MVDPVCEWCRCGGGFRVNGCGEGVVVRVQVYGVAVCKQVSPVLQAVVDAEKFEVACCV